MNWEEQGYFSIDKVARSLGVTRAKAKALLEREEGYQRTAAMKRGPYNKITAGPLRDGRPDQIQGDLLDVHTLARQNGGIRFLVTLVDVYSRRAWVLPIKRKSTPELMRVLEPFLREVHPFNITFDKEPGIRSGKMTALLKKLGIKRWFPVDLTNKGATAIVERFNRTVRQWLTRHEIAKGKRYLEDLPKFVRIYNRTYHRTLKKKPMEAWTDTTPQKPRVSRAPVGSKVRVKLRRGIFEKASKPAYSKEVYKVESYRGNRHQLVDGKGNPVKNVPVASDVRRVHTETALHQPKSPKARTFFAESISKPFTKELRRSKRGQRVDYGKFL